MCISISIILIVAIFAWGLFTDFSMMQLLQNFSPVVKQITQSEIGNKATMTIQSKTTEVSAINFSVNHLRGEFTTG